MKILQASIHQGDPSFVGRGRQCVTNSIMAIMKSNTHNVDQWTKCDMDDVLKDGDRIYQLIKTKIMKITSKIKIYLAKTKRRTKKCQKLKKT